MEASRLFDAVLKENRSGEGCVFVSCPAGSDRLAHAIQMELEPSDIRHITRRIRLGNAAAGKGEELPACCVGERRHQLLGLFATVRSDDGAPETQLTRNG